MCTLNCREGNLAMKVKEFYGAVQCFSETMCRRLLEEIAVIFFFYKGNLIPENFHISRLIWNYFLNRVTFCTFWSY